MDFDDIISKLKNELKEKKFVISEIKENEIQSRQKIQFLEEQVQELQANVDKLQKENILSKKALDDFSVPKAIDVDSAKDLLLYNF